MIFYLSPSKQLALLFTILYLIMLWAVQCSNLYLVGKLVFALVLVYSWYNVINIYALRKKQESILRICFKDDLLYLENKTGICFYGQLSKLCYLSKELIILHVSISKNNKSKIVLITQDSLPPLQFRRLSMQASR